MKKSALMLFAAIVLTAVTGVQAGVYFSQPEQTYNLGDIIEITADINPIEEGPLTLNLVCDEKKEIVGYESIPESKINFKLPLTTMHIKNLTGDCYFEALYGSDVYKSREFKISKKLNVAINVDSLFADPGERITISGRAEKLNGQGINGEVKISLPLISLNSQEEDADENNRSIENNESESLEKDNESETVSEEEMLEEIKESYGIDEGVYYGNVEGGVFSVSFNLSKTLPAGNYRIDVLAYMSSGENIIGEGIAMANLKVNQVLRGIELSLNNQNIDPGSEFIFKPVLKDQANHDIDDEVSIIIKDDSRRIYERVTDSGESITYLVPTNMSLGYYTIIASSEDLENSKTFFINEKQIAAFSLDNETLTVENIGNVRYRKDIEIELNGKPFVKKLDLDLGEIVQFKLSGSGSYDIRISDGETEISKSGISLTGRAIGVDEIKKGVSFKGTLIWIFVIIILGAGVVLFWILVMKKKSFAYPLSSRKKEVDFGRVIDSKSVKNKPAATPLNESSKPVIAPNQAEQVLVLKGHKNRVAVVAIKIKNKIGTIEKRSLERAIEHAYEKKGAVYEQGDYIFIIFSPLMTKSSKNEVEAAKAAEKISLVLEEHNKKFRDKIDFGIAINTGDIINKIEDKKLKFTVLGNLTSVAKRLASVSDKQILVTKMAYEHGISEIKAEKRSINQGEVYELRGIIDYEKNQKFIQGFLKRMNNEEKRE
jgi:hypothetical protein